MKHPVLFALLLSAATLLWGCSQQAAPAEQPPISEAEASPSLSDESQSPLAGTDVDAVEQAMDAAFRQEADILAQRLAEEMQLMETKPQYTSSAIEKYYITSPEDSSAGRLIYIYRLEVNVPADNTDLGDSATIFYLQVESENVQIENDVASLDDMPVASVSEFGLEDIQREKIEPLQQDTNTAIFSME